jgi:16S rRNA (adenine(1408)-N(1))-methyltransferase
MESIRGKRFLEIGEMELAARTTGYQSVLIDLGTGDGRFARHAAEARPDRFVIGVDTCRENLQSASRSALSNLLFLIADARALPSALDGLASQITINFPWGSLLADLLESPPAALGSLLVATRPGAVIQICLNGGALEEAGLSLEAGAGRLQQIMTGMGCRSRPALLMNSDHLRAFPSTWARRLAAGRDPRALLLSFERPPGSLRLAGARPDRPNKSDMRICLIHNEKTT